MRCRTRPLHGRINNFVARNEVEPTARPRSGLDVVVRLPLPVVGIEAGYGRFFGGRYLTETGFGTGAADFFYLQTLVGF